MLVECSPAIVAQINLVNNFTGSGVVKSFYVPYFCPECDEEKVLLVEATDMGPPPHEPPTCRCDECDLVMDFDDMPDSYFAFLANQKKLVEPDKINGAMRELGRGGEGTDGSGKAKLRSRASQPQLSGASRPSVPSLPSIQRSSSQPPSGAISKTASRSQLGAQPMTAPGATSGRFSNPANAGNNFGGFAQSMSSPVAEPARSNALVVVLITILLGAIGVLAYLVLTK